jgi:hypothetical protein
VRDAVVRSRAPISKGRATPAEVLVQAEFIGCVDGSRDPSACYKDELTNFLASEA